MEESRLWFPRRCLSNVSHANRSFSTKQFTSCIFIVCQPLSQNFKVMFCHITVLRCRLSFSKTLLFSTKVDMCVFLCDSLSFNFEFFVCILYFSVDFKRRAQAALFYHSAFSSTVEEVLDFKIQEQQISFKKYFDLDDFFNDPLGQKHLQESFYYY